jgi:4-carboxymuconolactone decarboxylase
MTIRPAEVNPLQTPHVWHEAGPATLGDCAPRAELGLARQRAGGRIGQLPGGAAGLAHGTRQSPVPWAGLLEMNSGFHPIGAMESTSARRGLVPDSGRRHMSQTVRFQETLRRLAMIDEGFVEDQAGLGLGLVKTSALDPKTAALLQVGVSVAIGSPAVCLEWSTGRALAAGATEEEVADVLLAITPVAGLGRVVAAAPDVAIALGYDVAAALEDPDGY